MTKRQKELITGKLLGDGSLENRGRANSRLQIRHSIAQKEYVDWSYLQLKEFVPSKPKRHMNSYYFRTKSLPLFSRIRKEWYIKNRKSLPENLRLSPFILAVWYMGDGYYDRKNKAMWLCTHCFNKQEIKFLQRLLREMAIDSGAIKDRTHYKLRVLSRCTDKFIKTIKPFIVPSLYYKIGIAP